MNKKQEMTSSTHRTDVAIIGAGPVGLFAIFECGMLKLKCHVIDALDAIGGQCAALYPEKPIYDIPAYPEILAKDLVHNLEEQAAPFSPHYHLGQQVVKLQRTEENRWYVETSKGESINAGAVIIAAGVGAFGPNRPPLKAIEDYEGTSVFYYVTRKEDFRDKTLVIAGGGDSALDWALSLKDIAKKIYLVHRRNKFRAAPDTLEKINTAAEKGEIDMVVPYQLSGLQGQEGHLKTVMVSTLDGQTRALEADCLLPFFGLSMNLGPIAEWGLGLEKKHISVRLPTCETNQKGIFAIGDVATYDAKLKLILTGFGEAAQAAHEIRHYLRPGEVFHFEYSTTQGPPSAQEFPSTKDTGGKGDAVTN